MFVVRKPSTALIRDLISQQQDLPFSYDEVGATRGELPAGYVHDHNRIQLGAGVDVFERAVDAPQAMVAL
jgi:uncharacterized protein (UPF0548 family)